MNRFLHLSDHTTYDVETAVTYTKFSEIKEGGVQIDTVLVTSAHGEPALRFEGAEATALWVNLRNAQ